MLCPNCRQDVGKHVGLSEDTGKNVFVFYVVGMDVRTGKTYCPKCVNKRDELFCNVCGASYKTQAGLEKHMKTHE